jgi:hypothetical protein
MGGQRWNAGEACSEDDRFPAGVCTAQEKRSVKDGRQKRWPHATTGREPIIIGYHLFRR